MKNSIRVHEHYVIVFLISISCVDISSNNHLISISKYNFFTLHLLALFIEVFMTISYAQN